VITPVIHHSQEKYQSFSDFHIERKSDMAYKSVTEAVVAGQIAGPHSPMLKG